MPINLTNLALASSLIFCSQHATAQIDQTVPSMNPTTNCYVNGASEIEGIKNYNFLTSDNCRNIFVRPESIGTQHIDYEIVGDMKFCKAIDIADVRIVDMESKLSVLYDKLFKVMEKTVNSSYSKKKQDQEIARLQRDIDYINDEIAKNLQRKDQKYGDLPGAKFSIINDTIIPDDDLIKIAKNNYIQVIAQEPGKEPQIYETKPGVRRAIITDSHYSFFYRKGSERETHSSVISTDAPATVASESKRHGIIHVEAGDTLNAEMVLNLPSICIGAKLESGEWELSDRKKNPIFTINRTYTVNQRAAYGYTADMRIPNVADRILNHLLSEGNDGFTMDDVFSEPIKNDISQFLTFEWHNQLGTDGQQISKKKIKAIKTELLAGYLKNYFSKLVKDKTLEVVGVRETGKKDGEFVTNADKKAKCYKSNLTQLCHSEVYKLVGWDGTSNESLKEKLTINQNFKKNVGVNQLEPSVFTSTFVPKFRKL